MPWITESDKRFWMPDILPEPTEEYQQQQSEKIYLTPEGKERRHPGWTYAENIAYVDDEYLFQNEGWKVVVDEVPYEPVLGRYHNERNNPNKWEELDEKTIKVTYNTLGWIPDVLPEPTEEYQQGQTQKKYLTKDENIIDHPTFTYVFNGSLVDDEYLFQNLNLIRIIDNKPSEPVIDRVHYLRNPMEQWEFDEKIVKVTYSNSGWIPKVFPKSTVEYEKSQADKTYLTEEMVQVQHPKWIYKSTNAYVDDEYLFQNEGWKLIVDDGGIEINKSDLKNKVKNEIDEWEEINEKTIKVTYTITDFTQEEIDIYEQIQYGRLRKKRDDLLSKTDWIVIAAKEKNLSLSPEIISYRQQLRDLPETIENIFSFKEDDDTLWPTKPEVYFEV